MGTVAVSAVCSRVAAALSTALSAGGWVEAQDPYDTFGEGDGDRLHLSYAIGVPQSQAMQDRQVLAAGAYTTTTLGVRWAYNLPAKDQVTGYRAGLDAEAALLAAVLTARQSNSLEIVWVDASREVAEGWMSGTITFRAIHRFALTS